MRLFRLRSGDAPKSEKEGISVPWETSWRTSFPIHEETSHAAVSGTEQTTVGDTHDSGEVDAKTKEKSPVSTLCKYRPLVTRWGNSRRRG